MKVVRKELAKQFFLILASKLFQGSNLDLKDIRLSRSLSVESVYHFMRVTVGYLSREDLKIFRYPERIHQELQLRPVGALAGHRQPQEVHQALASGNPQLVGHLAGYE